MKIHSICFFLPLLILLAQLNSSACGQFRDIPPKYEELHIVCLLGFPSIMEHLQKEHGLADKHFEELKELGRNRLKNMHARKDFRRKTAKMSDKQFAKARAKLFESILEFNEDSWVKAEKLLTEEQIARLKQLRIQRLGVAALADSEVIDVLELSKEKVESGLAQQKIYNGKILALRAEQSERRKLERFVPQSKKDIERNKANSKEMAEAKVEYRKQAYIAVLGEQGALSFDAMTGELFVFKLDFNFQKPQVDWQVDPLKKFDKKPEE